MDRRLSTDPIVDPLAERNVDDRVRIVYYKQNDILINFIVGLTVSLISATIFALFNNFFFRRQAKKIADEAAERDKAVIDKLAKVIPQTAEDPLVNAKVNMIPNRSLKRMIRMVKRKPAAANDKAPQDKAASSDAEQHEMDMVLHEAFESNAMVSKRSFLIFIYMNGCPWARRAAPQVAKVHQWIKERNAFNAAQSKPVPLFLYAINVDDIIDPHLQNYIRTQGIPYFLFYNANTKSLGRFTASHPDFYAQEIENLYHALQSNEPVIVQS